MNCCLTCASSKILFIHNSKSWAFRNNMKYEKWCKQMLRMLLYILKSSFVKKKQGWVEWGEGWWKKVKEGKECTQHNIIIIIFFLLYFSSTLSSFLFYIIYLMPATGQNCNFKYMILSIQLPPLPTTSLSHWKISTLCVRLYTFMCLLNGHKHKIIYFSMYVESHTKQQHNTTFSFFFFHFILYIFFTFSQSWGHQNIIYRSSCVFIVSGRENKDSISLNTKYTISL